MNNDVLSNPEEIKLIKRHREVQEHEEYQYLHLLEDIMEKGVRTPNRTGVDTLTIPHVHLSFDVSKGFPLLTHKKMAKKTFAVELEGFIKGVTDKSWYQERGCHIWDEWCNPLIVPYGTDEETQKKMKDESNLGKIYGYQWRNFNGAGVIDGRKGDQLQNIVRTLKTNPNDRRMVCSAWNPLQIDEMALPPCHVLWNVTVINDTLNLCWFQRSCDVALGIPANIFSYGLLLHLLCLESGFKEGKLSGFLSNCHIYENQINGVKEAISRPLYKFPQVVTKDFKSIFTWEHTQTSFKNYKSGESIKMPIAV